MLQCEDRYFGAHVVNKLSKQIGSIAVNAAVAAGTAGVAGAGVVAWNATQSTSQQLALEDLVTESMPAALATAYYSGVPYAQLRDSDGRSLISSFGVEAQGWEVVAVTSGRGGQRIEIGFETPNPDSAIQLLAAAKSVPMSDGAWMEGTRVVVSYGRP